MKLARSVGCDEAARATARPSGAGSTLTLGFVFAGHTPLVFAMHQPQKFSATDVASFGKSVDQLEGSFPVIFQRIRAVIKPIQSNNDSLLGQWLNQSCCSMPPGAQLRSRPDRRPSRRSRAKAVEGVAAKIRSSWIGLQWSRKLRVKFKTRNLEIFF